MVLFLDLLKFIKMELVKMIKMVKSKDFAISYYGYDGIILYNREHGIRCFIDFDRSDNWVRMSKYFDFNDKSFRSDIRGGIEIFNLDEKYFFEWCLFSFQRSFERAKKEYLKNNP